MFNFSLTNIYYVFIFSGGIMLGFEYNRDDNGFEEFIVYVNMENKYII